MPTFRRPARVLLAAGGFVALLAAACFSLLYEWVTIFTCTACEPTAPTFCRANDPSASAFELAAARDEFGAQIAAHGRLCDARYPDAVAGVATPEHEACRNRPEGSFTFTCRSSQRWAPRLVDPTWGTAR